MINSREGEEVKCWSIRKKKGPQRRVLCVLASMVSRGQEVQRTTCVACFRVDDIGINVRLSRDSKG
jgi:hypothetical protein